MKAALDRLISVLERTQFNDGALDLKLCGLDGPICVSVGLNRCAAGALDSLSAELSGIATGLHAIAEAIEKRAGVR